MRLLLDEQLSEALCHQLRDVFPDSAHVRTLLGPSTPDEQVWTLAIEQGFVLVTKDEDFHRLSVLRGSPPKVVWVRLGNCTTNDIAELLRRHYRDIETFVDQNEVTFLALG